MVKLTEVEDEHFKDKSTTTKDHTHLLSDDDDDDDFTDTDSEISSDSYTTLERETLLERLSALKDIIPPSSRRKISSTFSSLASLTRSTFSLGGKTLWVVSTSAFLLGVPWALALAEEQQFVQMEREQGMIKGANEVRN
ncbi:mitochondrial import receptor subunit Tom22 [Emydomyces testavorans]|uniref:Mitochondrial import receptor subunit Tom22 n=1 Tax=Emydomyces testavorans TaxID=2070801 RepID=A0AAF0DRN3_9EURO|nr:mitochondrial import receptor subunit Tom22 [Emydomyces testavorans]